MSNTQPEISRDSEKQNPARNALRHGCCAVESLILETEKIEDYCRLASPKSQDAGRHPGTNSF
jgi:hypothetical protein